MKKFLIILFSLIFLVGCSESKIDNMRRRNDWTSSPSERNQSTEATKEPPISNTPTTSTTDEKDKAVDLKSSRTTIMDKLSTLPTKKDSSDTTK